MMDRDTLQVVQEQLRACESADPAIAMQAYLSLRELGQAMHDDLHRLQFALINLRLMFEDKIEETDDGADVGWFIDPRFPDALAIVDAVMTGDTESPYYPHLDPYASRSGDATVAVSG